MDKDYKLKYNLDWIQCTGIKLPISIFYCNPEIDLELPVTNAVTMTVLKNP